ncbi:MAG: site-specific integrase, partial [bacterium]|nr:site-specific integrase [bacterium]
MATNPRNTDSVVGWLARFPASTAEAYGRDLHQFTAWFGQDPLAASRTDIQRWLGHLCDLGRAAPTVRRKASAL